MREIVGFFYFWPLALLATVAVCVCAAFTRPESLDGVLTEGGKRMVRSRVFLGAGCAMYYLCIAAGVAFKSADEPALVLGFWVKHRHAFLALMGSAETALLVAAIYSFGARGSRSWIVRIATVLVVLSSTFVLLGFAAPE
jgi:hypothetical protein